MQYVLGHEYIASSVAFARCVFFFKVEKNIVEGIEISIQVDIPGSYETNTKLDVFVGQGH